MARSPVVVPAALPPELLKYHRHNNRESAPNWGEFTAHRTRLTELASAVPGGTLAVLGAGNCNDLDLPRLTAAFETVHLVDIDDEALRRARARQPAEVAAKIALHAPVDLTGVFEKLPGFRARAPGGDEATALAERGLARVRAALPEHFDTVVSACILSQLMHSCWLAIGTQPQLETVARAVALVHLRSLMALTRPGGRALLVTDVVSSQTYPLEELWGTRTPSALLAELEKSGNVLSGTAPSFVRRIVSTDPQIAPLLAEPAAAIEPWLWRLGPDITFLVYALVLQRRSS